LLHAGLECENDEQTDERLVSYIAIFAAKIKLIDLCARIMASTEESMSIPSQALAWLKG